MDHRDNETWLIDSGHAVIEKRAAQGEDALTPRELLLHRLWVADYAMRNAGDLSVARELAPRFREEGFEIARLLELPQASAFFALGAGEIERRFFDLFDTIVQELRRG